MIAIFTKRTYPSGESCFLDFLDVKSVQDIFWSIGKRGGLSKVLSFSWKYITENQVYVRKYSIKRVTSVKKLYTFLRLRVSHILEYIIELMHPRDTDSLLFELTCKLGNM